MQVPENSLLHVYQCFGGDICCAFLTFLFKSFLPAPIFYNLTPVRAFGKSVKEKLLNHGKAKLAEAVEICDVFNHHK